MATYPTDVSALTNKKPDRGATSVVDFKNAVYESQVGYSKSRNVSRRRLETIDISYTNVTGTVKSGIETFFNDRNGSHETFVFDKSHINESGLITVRFREGSLRIVRVQQRATEANSIYTISFVLEQTYR